MVRELEGSRLVEYFIVYDITKAQFVLTPFTFADTFVLVPLDSTRLRTGHLLMTQAFVVYYKEMGLTVEKAKTKQEELEKKKDDKDTKKKGKYVNIIK